MKVLCCSRIFFYQFYQQDEGLSHVNNILEEIRSNTRKTDNFIQSIDEGKYVGLYRVLLTLETNVLTDNSKYKNYCKIVLYHVQVAVGIEILSF